MVLPSPVGDHIASAQAPFYAAAAVLWLVGVGVVVYRKLRASS